MKIKSGLILACLYSCLGVWAKPITLNIYSWSGYLPREILQQFTQETGIQVNYSTYESNEALYTKLTAMPRHRYDIIMPSTDMVDRMVQEDMVEPLDKDQLTHYKYLNANFLHKAYDPGNQYSIPYLFSSTGLVINSKVVAQGMNNKTWYYLWEPQWKNKLLVLDDVRELFSIALLRLGYSPNTHSPEEIQQAYQELKKLLSNIRVFTSEGMESLYAEEDILVGIGWSGDIYRASRLNANIQFIYPQEGYILSIDNLVIPKGARHVQEAHQLIDFLLRPDIAAAVSIATGYGTTNSHACEYLPKSMLANNMVYFDQSTLDRGIIQLSAGKEKILYEKYWQLLKMGG
jgi:spermidine/putrescine transport system substrate-binding protein